MATISNKQKFTFYQCQSKQIQAAHFSSVFLMWRKSWADFSYILSLRKATQLLKSIQEWLASFNVDFQFNVTQILFLKLDEHPLSITNFTILCFKYFIWKVKFSNGEVILPLFLQFFFSKLKDLKEAMIYRNRMYDFDRWNSIFDHLNNLSRTRPRTEQHLEVEEAEF